MDWNDIFGSGSFQDSSQLPDLYKRYPNFDKYPKYMQDALITNERLQGRMK